MSTTTSTPYRQVLAATGLRREAQLIAAGAVLTIAGGGDAASLRERLDLAVQAPSKPVGVISVGLGGALSPELAVGDWVVACCVLAGDHRWDTDRAWKTALTERLTPPAHTRASGDPVFGDSVQPDLDPRVRGDERNRRSAGRVLVGPILGSDAMVISAAAKASLHQQTGALAVDMESHVAARFAADRRLPFAALRVISDTAGRDLPRAVLAGMRPDGGMDLFGVLRALAADPRQLPALIRTGRDADLAFSRLRLLGGVHLLCGPGIGCPYLG